MPPQRTRIPASAVTGAPARPARPRKVPRVVVLGGGYVGLYAALRLRRRLGKREAAIVVVDPRSYLTYQPFLPEAAAGSVEPRHVVVSPRKVLRGCNVVTAAVSRIEHARQVVLLQ